MHVVNSMDNKQYNITGNRQKASQMNKNNHKKKIWENYYNFNLISTVWRNWDILLKLQLQVWKIFLHDQTW